MSEQKLTYSHLRLAGWLAIVSAIITLPVFMLSIVAYIPDWADQSRLLGFVNTLLYIVHAGMYAYILLTFRDYLRLHSRFTQVGMLINIIVAVNVVSAVLQVLAFIFSDFTAVSSTLSFLLLFPFGIVTIVLGLRLFRLKDALFGLRNPLCYLLIFTGVAITSVILLIPGILLGLVLDVLLGIVLIRAADEHAV